MLKSFITTIFLIMNGLYNKILGFYVSDNIFIIAFKHSIILARKFQGSTKFVVVPSN